MKTLTTIIALVTTATLAQAQPFANVATERYYPSRPTKISVNGQTIHSPTIAQLVTGNIYPTTRKPLPEGHRYLANDFRLEEGRAVDYTPTINKAEEWAANNQKVAKRVEKEAELVQLLTSPVIGLTVPIQEDDVYTVMDKGSAWVAAGATDAIRVDRLTLLLEALGAWTKFGDEIYSPWIGRQPTTGDYPQ